MSEQKENIIEENATEEDIKIDGKNSLEGKSRRNFLNWLLGITSSGLALLMTYPLLRYIVPPKLRQATVSSVELGKIDDFKKGRGEIFKFGRKPGLLIRTKNGDFKAFHATCTHLDCTVQYRDDLDIIWCACHNGVFDLDGLNISGPPPEPLPKYKVIIRGDKVIVKQESDA